MAEVVISSLALQHPGIVIAVESAGTHAHHTGHAADPRTQAALLNRGYPQCNTTAKPVIDEHFERFDIILAMDRVNLQHLMRRCPPAQRHKLKLLLAFAPGTGRDEVPDPYYGSPRGFELALDLCEAGARGLLAELHARQS